MKAFKFIVPAVVGLLSVSFVACSDDDDTPASKVPDAVKTSFTGMYPTAKKVDWEKKANYYVADFNDKGLEVEAWYHDNGSWAMSSTDYNRSITGLPQAVIDAYNQSEYVNDYTIDDVDIYERPTDTFSVIEIEKPGSRDIHLIYDNGGTLLNTVTGNLTITPTTDISAL